MPPVILVDQAAAHFPPADRCVRRRDRLLVDLVDVVPVGRSWGRYGFRGKDRPEGRRMAPPPTSARANVGHVAYLHRGRGTDCRAPRSRTSG